MIHSLNESERLVLQSLVMGTNHNLDMKSALAMLTDRLVVGVPKRSRQLAAVLSSLLDSGYSLGSALEKTGVFPSDICQFLNQKYLATINPKVLIAFQKYYNSSHADHMSIWKTFTYQVVMIWPMMYAFILNIVLFFGQFESIFSSVLLKNTNFIYSTMQLLLTVNNKFSSFCADLTSLFLDVCGVSAAWAVEWVSGVSSNLLLSLIVIFMAFIFVSPFLGLRPTPFRSFRWLKAGFHKLMPVFNKIKNLRLLILFTDLALDLKQQGDIPQEFISYLQNKYQFGRTFVTGSLYLRWQNALQSDDYEPQLLELQQLCQDEVAAATITFNSFAESFGVIVVAFFTAGLMVSVFSSIHLILQACIAL